jgi:branched-chain amino acid transport system substrate-binding protein
MAKGVRLVLALVLAAAAVLGFASVRSADAQAQTIKIGLLYDHTGPFSAAGSLNCWRGAKMMIDFINEKGGVLGKYKIVQVDGDSQSKTEAAINEAERLLNVEKVDILAGVYSSAHAVPLAEKVDKQKKFLWITTAISDAVVKDRNLEYTFRPQTNSGLFGVASVQYIAGNAEEKFKKAVKDLRIAIIYEDGPYGVGVATANEAEAKRQGMQVVLKEGYSISAPDLSSLVTKLRAARPDVLYHTGYNPDINLLLRQSKEQGFRVRAYIGHGAGHSQLDKLKEAFGADRPQAAQGRGGRADPGDGEALQDLRAEHPGRCDRTPRLHGLQQHVDPSERRAPARDPEARRIHAGRPREGRARDRHPRGRHHAGVRGQVLR